MADASGNPLALIELPAGPDGRAGVGGRLPAGHAAAQRAAPPALRRTGRCSPRAQPPAPAPRRAAPRRRRRADADRRRVRVRPRRRRGGRARLGGSPGPPADVRAPADAGRRRRPGVGPGTPGGAPSAGRSSATTPDVRALHLADAVLGTDDEVARLLDERGGAALARGDATPSRHGAAARGRPDLRRPLTAPGGWPRRRTSAPTSPARWPVPARCSSGLAPSTPTRPRPCEVATAAAAHLLNSDGGVDTAHRMLARALAGVAARNRERPSERQVVEEAVHTLMLVCAFGGRQELWAAFEDAVARSARPLPRAATGRGHLRRPCPRRPPTSWPSSTRLVAGRRRVRQPGPGARGRHRRPVRRPRARRRPGPRGRSPADRADRSPWPLRRW